MYVFRMRMCIESEREHGSALAETIPRPDSEDPLRNDRLSLDSELTRPNRSSHDMTRTNSADSRVKAE